ncbi:MAG: M13 family metallopeptidase [Clostridiales bacterium]|nr:M13 family metallopeptidase [Clostridiales bacterium]
MSLKIKKPVSVLLAAFMMLSMCSCSGGQAQGQGQEQQQSAGGYHFKWMDSALSENFDKMSKASVKDDFSAAVNYEWASQQKEDFTYSISSFGEASRKVVQNKRAMIEDKSFQNKNIELVRIADGLFNDIDYRNSLGVEPLKKYLGYIDDIKTIDDVTSYMTDNAKNPFALSLVKMDYSENEALDGDVALELSRPDLTLSKGYNYVSLSKEGFKTKDKVEKRIRYLLDRCGYSEKQIKDVISGCFRLETKLVYLDTVEYEDLASVKTRDEILEMAGKYPLKEMLDHYSITTCNNFMGELDFFDGLESIYVQKNVEDIKAYFKARLALESILYLDKGAFDFYFDSEVDRTNKYDERINREQDFYFFRIIENTALTAAVDQAYLDYYFDEATYKEVKDYIRQIKEKYLILIDQNEHLSDASKKAVRAKLDKMGENVMTPSNKADFSGVELKSKEDGGSFLDAMCELNRIKNEHIGELVQMHLGRSYWDIYSPRFSTTSVGASYYSMQNTIYIKMGFLVEPMYSHDYPLERKLGCLVAVLGHEISHAFDVNNISYDADGRNIDIVTKEELAFINDVKARIQSHFAGYEPFEGCGAYVAESTVPGEVIADAEGLKVALMIGKDHEGFDYDKFFRSYAIFWRTVETKADQMDDVANDNHPLDYLRINYTMLQFDEFIETYGIKPGDGMYMDPSERILIW